MPELILIRGIPGSGKSTLAKTYVEKGFNHFEADQYFMKDGEYLFNQKLLHEAHTQCFENTAHALKAGENTVVSNTFTRLFEMRNYIELAVDNQYKLSVIRCVGSFKNVHDVPDNVIEKMTERFELYRGEHIYESN